MNPVQRSGEAAQKFADAGTLVGFSLVGVARRHRAAVAAEFAPLGLHVGQEMLLSQLRHHIGPPVGIEPTP